MLAAPLLTQHSFSIHFPRHSSIRRDVNRLEDALNAGCVGGYGPPQSLPIPDEFGPEIPRVVFNAVSGFSTIAVSQLSIALSVNYSNDWQPDREKCVDYLRRRAHVLFEMLRVVDINASFVGIGTKLHLLSSSNDLEEVMDALRSLFAPDFDLLDTNEVALRISKNVDDKFFNNTNVSSFAVWQNESQSIGRLPRNSRVATGIEVAGDYNNRLAYNEDATACATLEDSLSMIDSATNFAYRLANSFGEGHA